MQSISRNNFQKIDYFFLFGFFVNILAYLLLVKFPLHSLFASAFYSQLLIFTSFMEVVTIGFVLKRFYTQPVLGFMVIIAGIVIVLFFDCLAYCFEKGYLRTGIMPAGQNSLALAAIGRILFAFCLVTCSFTMNSIIGKKSKLREKVIFIVLISLLMTTVFIASYLYLLPLLKSPDLITFLSKQGFYFISVAIFLLSAILFFRSHLNGKQNTDLWLAAAAALLLFSSLYRTLGTTTIDIYSNLYLIGTIFAFLSFVIAIFEDNERFITAERKLRTELENSLFETERSIGEYDQLLERTNLGLGQFNQKNEVISANETLHRILGYENSSLINKPFTALIRQKHKDQFGFFVDKWQSGDAVQFEINLRKKNGEDIVAAISIVPSTNNQGDYTGAQFVVLDISSWKNSERALRKRVQVLDSSSQEKEKELNRLSEEFRSKQHYYKSILSGITEIIIVVNDQGNCTYINDAGQKALGYSAKELTKNKIPAFFRDLEQMKADYGQSLNVDLRDYEYDWKTKHGTVLTGMWRIKFLFDKNNNRIGTIGIGRDITHQKKIVQEMQQTQKDFDGKLQREISVFQNKLDQFSRLLKISQEMVVRQNPASFAQNLCKIIRGFGWKRSAIVMSRTDSNKIEILASVGFAANESNELNRIRQNGLEEWLRGGIKISQSSFNKDHLFVPVQIKNNTIGWFMASQSSEKTPDEYSVKLLQIMANFAGVLLENIQVFKRVESTSQELKKVDQLKTEFIANTSHELRTPLNSVLTVSELLLKQIAGRLNSEQKKQIQLIRSNAETLLFMINEVLDTLRIDSGSSLPEFSYFSVQSLVQSVVAPLEPMCKSKNLKLDKRIYKKVPERIFSDKDKLIQSLTNLVSNAIKFTEKGKISVKVSTAASHSRLCFSVQDTGLGIPDEELNKIFDEFKRVKHAQYHQTIGSGLGLGIARKNIELLGGEIIVKSKVNRGTIFDIYLPLKKSGDVYVAGESVRKGGRVSRQGPRNVVPEPKFANQKKKSNKKQDAVNTKARQSQSKNSFVVLVIDDDEGNQYATKFFLEDQGFEVVSAGTGTEGVKLAGKMIPNLILMDMMIPELDGIQATKKLKSMPKTKKIPIIAMTARSLTKDREKALQAGCVDYLTKPFSMDDLVSKIKKWM